MLNQKTDDCQVIIGADVSKNTISFFNSTTNECINISNNKRCLHKYLKLFSKPTIAVEATGGYEVKLIDVALSLDATIYRLSPYRVKGFMKASGERAKTDFIDAKALADYVKIYKSTLIPYVPLPEEEKKLRQFIKRRDELIVIRTKERNREKAPDNDNIISSIKRILLLIEKEIVLIEKQIEELIKKSLLLKEKISVMMSVSGVGITTATSLLAHLPEIGTINRKEIASLAGLAPFAKDSGKKTGYRRTGIGRRGIKNAIFMSCLTAIRYNKQFKDFYEHLIKNGKKPMVAVVAVARKMITVLNAKVRDEVYLKKISKQS